MPVSFIPSVTSLAMRSSPGISHWTPTGAFEQSWLICRALPRWIIPVPIRQCVPPVPCCRGRGVPFPSGPGDWAAGTAKETYSIYPCIQGIIQRHCDLAIALGIAPHEGGFGQYMPAHGRLEAVLVGTRQRGQGRIQGIEPEKVPMSADGRARAAIPFA